jgi:hypothetical protein
MFKPQFQVKLKPKQSKFKHNFIPKLKHKFKPKQPKFKLKLKSKFKPKFKLKPKLKKSHPWGWVAAGDGRDRTQGRERWRADSVAEDLGPEWSQRRGRGSQRCNVGRQDGVSGREHRHGRWSIVLGRAGAGPTQGWAGTGPSRRGPAVATQWGLAAAARRCGERRQRQNEEIFQSRMH